MDMSLAQLLGAGLGAVLGWLVAFASYRASLAQYRLSASSAAADWLRDLRTWASEAIDVLAKAAYESPKGDSDPKSQHTATLNACRFQLSALIDKGRLFLPNEQETVLGSHKPRAYRGLRHPALDALVAAERILGGDADLGSFPDRKTALIGLRREFVSTVQSILDPQSYNREIARLLRLAGQSRQRDPTVGGLLPPSDSVPTGAAGLIAVASRRYEEDTRSGKPGP
jgi:hypothetical protein